MNCQRKYRYLSHGKGIKFVTLAQKEIVMPKIQPTLPVERVRNVCELYQWETKYGQMTRGFVPPKDAKKLSRVPFFIKYVTKSGRLEEGMCVSLKMERRKGMRMIQYVNSRAIRWIYDILIIEVNGFRVING